ncbi:hypothetical protein [Catenulispora pinistramenti]|nr:hypothetical protein [Catenulispora pinistramenti]
MSGLVVCCFGTLVIVVLALLYVVLSLSAGAPPRVRRDMRDQR